MPKGKLNLTNKVGKLGEDLACKFLMKRNYKIIERNYLKPWGEIDIIATNNRKIYFYEVKSVTCVTKEGVRKSQRYRAEENVHPYKIAKLRRVVETYLLEQGAKDIEWEFGVVTVHLNESDRVAHIKLIPNIVL